MLCYWDSNRCWQAQWNCLISNQIPTQLKSLTLVQLGLCRIICAKTLFYWSTKIRSFDSRCLISKQAKNYFQNIKKNSQSKPICTIWCLYLGFIGFVFWENIGVCINKPLLHTVWITGYESYYAQFNWSLCRPISGHED